MTNYHGLSKISLVNLTNILRSVIRKQSLLRLLTRASPENLEVINKILEKHKKSDMYFEVRHSELEPRLFPDYMIRDEEEILFSLTPYEDLTTTKPAEYRGLWTNSQSFIRAIKLLFEKSWNEAVDT